MRPRQIATIAGVVAVSAGIAIGGLLATGHGAPARLAVLSGATTSVPIHKPGTASMPPATAYTTTTAEAPTTSTTTQVVATTQAPVTTTTAAGASTTTTTVPPYNPTPAPSYCPPGTTAWGNVEGGPGYTWTEPILGDWCGVPTS